MQPFKREPCQIVEFGLIDVCSTKHSPFKKTIMKTIMKPTQTKFYITFILLFALVLQVNAECNTSTPVEPNINPGGNFEIAVNFHTAGGNLRRMIIENESYYINTLNGSLTNVDEIEGNTNNNFPLATHVLYADDYHLGGGDHDLVFSGNTLSSVPCGVVIFFRIKFQKKDIFWWTECSRTFYININSEGNVDIQAGDETCGLAPLTFNVSGSSASEYVWTSSNPSFTLNGSSDWPITTDNANVVIAPTNLGSSTNISVAATGSSICGVANASHSIQSIDASITLSGVPFTCNATGNPITVQATPLDGAIYTWSYRNVISNNWSPPISSMSNLFTVPGSNVAATYVVKCGVSYNGCNSKSNLLEIKWCVNTNPNIPRACCIKHVPTEKKKSIRRSEENRDMGQAIEVDVYPNPTSGKLTISSNTAIQRILIVDYQGKEMVQVQLDSKYSTELNLANFPAGMYMVRVITMHDSKTIKMVKTE